MIAKWLLLRIAGFPGRPATAVIYLTGDLDETSRPLLNDCLRRLASKRASRLVLDLSNVTSLDSGSAAAMLAAASAVLPDGVQPVVRNPPPVPQALRIFRQGDRCDLEPRHGTPRAPARPAEVVATS